MSAVPPTTGESIGVTDPGSKTEINVVLPLPPNGSGPEVAEAAEKGGLGVINDELYSSRIGVINNADGIMIIMIPHHPSTLDQNIDGMKKAAIKKELQVYCDAGYKCSENFLKKGGMGKAGVPIFRLEIEWARGWVGKTATWRSMKEGPGPTQLVVDTAVEQPPPGIELLTEPGHEDEAKAEAEAEAVGMFTDEAEFTLNDNGKRQRAPKFTKSCKGRMIHVIADKALASELAAMYMSMSRADLDDKSTRKQISSIWNEGSPGHVRFNSSDVVYPAIHDDTGMFQDLLINQVPERAPAELKKWHTKVIAAFTVAYSNHTKSGQNDPDTFWNFCAGDAMLYYAYKVWKDLPCLDIVLKLLPEGAEVGAGLQDGDLPGAGANGTKGTHSRGRKDEQDKERAAEKDMATALTRIAGGIEAALLSRPGPGANPQATRAAAAAPALAPAASTEAEDAIARHQRLLNEMEQTQGILNSCLDAELAAMYRSRIQGLMAICFASAVPAVTPPHTGA